MYKETIQSKLLRIKMIQNKKIKSEKKLIPVSDVNKCYKLQSCRVRRTNIIEESYEPSDYEKKILGIK